MSFSKAKIQRFNDEKPCAPPPGAYNPEKIDKSVGPIIHKSERFTENYKFLIHASSTESLCSVASERGTFSTDFGTFKTPRVPTICRGSRTNVTRRGNFPHSKSVSTDFINKKSSSHDQEHEMNPLKYSMHFLQDELAIEKTRNQELAAELNQMNENNSEAERFSEYLVDTVQKKNIFVDLLTEKCNTLQQISVQSFESYQSYIKQMHDVLRVHTTLSSETDSCLAQLIEHYEKLVAEYEQDMESFFVFLVDLQQKQSCKTFDRSLLDRSSEQCNLLLETLQGTKRGQKQYEIIIKELRNVINVLSGRVRESDKEVEKTYQIICGLQQEKTKLSEIILSKDKEITTMRDVVDAVSKKFFVEVHHTENNLSALINEFEVKATAEREKYEADLHLKDSIISELLKTKNAIELQLQEALDEIELSKCREENLKQSFDSVKCTLRDKCVQFKIQYEACLEKLRDLERTYELDAGDVKLNLQNDSVRTQVDMVKKIVDSFIQTNVLSEEVENRFAGVEKFEEQISLLRELMSSSTSDSQKLDFLPHLINAVSHTFSKFSNDNDALKNDVTRLRDDFIEKCEECGQLTKLLQLSEKKVENYESETTELESRLAKLEANLEKQQSSLTELESENCNLKQQLAFESNVKKSELIIEDGEKDATMKATEIALKEERMKNEEQTKRIAALETLVAKLEADKKLMVKSDPKVNPKHFIQRNQEAKSKIAVLQPTKNSRNLFRKVEGKENKVVTRNNETFEIRKTTSAEVPMNESYVVTSPKVSRI